LYCESIILAGNGSVLLKQWNIVFVLNGGSLLIISFVKEWFRVVSEIVRSCGEVPLPG
jgi:hypothetical protein